MCNIDKVPFINSLIFVIHGNRDEIVPFSHGEELYLAAKPKYRYTPFWVDGAGHNNIEVCVRKVNPQLFFEKIREFLKFVKSHPNGIEHLGDGNDDSYGKNEAYDFQSHLFCCAKGDLGQYGDDDDYDGEDIKMMKDFDSSKLTIHTPATKQQKQQQQRGTTD